MVESEVVWLGADDSERVEVGVGLPEVDWVAVWVEVSLLDCDSDWVAVFDADCVALLVTD